MIYELPYSPMDRSKPSTVWWQGKLPAHGMLELSRPNTMNYNETPLTVSKFEQALVDAGLFLDEAKALFKTWQNSYFNVETGLKVFWIVPRIQVDSILPLTINPLPQHLERVIVGRTEILTPQFENELIHAQQVDSLQKYKSDKYYFAYLDYLKNPSTTSLFSNSFMTSFPRNGFSIGFSVSGPGFQGPFLYNPADKNPLVNIQGRAIFSNGLRKIPF